MVNTADLITRLVLVNAASEVFDVQMLADQIAEARARYLALKDLLKDDKKLQELTEAVKKLEELEKRLREFKDESRRKLEEGEKQLRADAEEFVKRWGEKIRRSEWAGDADPAVQKTFDKLMGAIKVNDRDAFVADATDEVKKRTTQQEMAGLNKELGPRLSKGYQATYLGQLKQQGYQVHLWKGTFKDDGDDLLFRVVLKGGKVAGYFAQ
jgi:hypothetical protein